ncbi:hypothetical protein BDR05DRAFT_994283 [Suillus weaverae]|nr:hypothetical protein BDR05DRAFT_994283 [Suillus weaverae]
MFINREFITAFPSQVHTVPELEFLSVFEMEQFLNSKAEHIKTCRVALRMSPPGHFMILHFFATRLHARFKRRGVLSDLDEAIEVHLAALELRLSSHPD